MITCATLLLVLDSGHVLPTSPPPCFGNPENNKTKNKSPDNQRVYLTLTSDREGVASPCLSRFARPIPRRPPSSKVRPWATDRSSWHKPAIQHCRSVLYHGEQQKLTRAPNSRSHSHAKRSYISMTKEGGGRLGNARNRQSSGMAVRRSPRCQLVADED